MGAFGVTRGREHGMFFKEKGDVHLKDDVLSTERVGNRYGAEQIKVLEGIEAVRKKARYVCRRHGK